MGADGLGQIGGTQITHVESGLSPLTLYVYLLRLILLEVIAHQEGSGHVTFVSQVRTATLAWGHGGLDLAAEVHYAPLPLSGYAKDGAQRRGSGRLQ